MFTEMQQSKDSKAFQLPLKNFFLAVQDFTLLSVQAVLNIFKKPYYWEETIEQMDYIGVRSLPLVVSISFFVGMVLTLQLTSELAVFGAKIYLGRVTSPSIVRELGPVITGVIVAGRAISGMTADRAFYFLDIFIPLCYHT